MKKILLLLALVCSIGANAQINLYVDSSITASGVGGDWTTAYKTLNEALDSATRDTTDTAYIISIAKGTYFPTGVQSGTNRDSTFLIARGGIRLYGGFPNGGGNADVAANPTILSGGIGIADTTDNSYHVMVISNIDSTADSIIVDGITIRDGNANLYSSATAIYNSIALGKYIGGGLLIAQANGHMLFNNCIITGNYALLGAGDYNKDITSSGFNPLFTDCSFFQNNTFFSGEGGGMFNSFCSAGITNCSFTGNAGSYYGGGIHNYMSSPSITYSAFSGNTSNNGGAIYTNAGAPNISFCSFASNVAAQNGGAVSNNSQGTQFVSIYKCNFTDNAGGYGGGVYISQTQGTVPAAAPIVDSCTFSNNTATLGGGVFFQGADVICQIHACIFNENKASNGGGLYSNCSMFTGTVYPSVSRCTFFADSAGKGGGAYVEIKVNMDHCLFTNNKANMGGGLFFAATKLDHTTLTGNTASGFGGGIYITGAYLRSLENNLIYGNTAGVSGGAIYDTLCPTLNIENCTLSGDTAVNGNGIYFTNTNFHTVTNCIVWEGSGSSIINGISSTPSVTHCDVQGGYPGTGNLSVSPGFVDSFAASSAPDTLGNYRLTPCSTLIGAGQNSGPYTGGSDLADSARLYGVSVDMGAYEYQGQGPQIISGPGTICVGGSNQFFQPVSTGTWYTSNNSIATIDTVGVASGIAVGVDTLSYVADLATCSYTATKVITVVLPPVVAGITAAAICCMNSMDTLYDSTPGGVWGSADLSIASISAIGVLSPHAPGTDTITYIVTINASCADTASVSITVVPLPFSTGITGDSLVCANSMIVLNDTTAGGIWSNGNTGSASIDSSGVLSAISPGVVPVFYTITDSNGCMATATKTVIVSGVNTNVQFLAGQLVVAESGAAYQWVNCPDLTAITGDTSQAFTPTTSGSYAVIISTLTGCKDTSACTTITLGVASVSNIAACINIYPNPASGNLTIQSENFTPTQITLKDITGKTILQTTPTGYTSTMDLSGVAGGVYLIEISDGKEKYTQKVSVLH